MTKQEDEFSQDEILEQLLRHLKEGRPVTLYNTYQGVPITYEADVAMVHADFVGLIVHPYQAVCIKEERRTYLESKSLPALVRANPVSIDYTNQVVMLKRLKIPKSISADLFNAWVEPEKPVMVRIHSEENGELKAPMIEMAMLDENQARVVVAMPKEIPFTRLEPLDLTFRLTRDTEPVRMQGYIHSVTKLRNQDQKRVEIAGKAAMKDEISMLAYVAKREDQIMDGLDKVYKKLRKGKKRSAK